MSTSREWPPGTGLLAGALGYDKATAEAFLTHIPGLDRQEAAPVTAPARTQELLLAAPSTARAETNGWVVAGVVGRLSNTAELVRGVLPDAEPVPHSSAEILLAAYRRWGHACASELQGTYAFALWDEARNELSLGRDPIGLRSLYYREEGGRVLFASRLRALLASRLVPRALALPALWSYLSYGVVHAPWTAMEGVRVVPPGHVVIVGQRGLRLERYWQPRREPKLDLDREGAARAIVGRLEQVVRHEAVGDSALLLSGGVDSALLAALAAPERPRTVGLVFEGWPPVEAARARKVAAALALDHATVELYEAAFIAQLPEVFSGFDQPTNHGLYVDALARAARTAEARVALTGFGADELFDGNGYVSRIRALEQLRQLPRAATRLAGWTAGALGDLDPKAALWLAGRFRPGSSLELLRRFFLPEEIRRLLPGIDAEEEAFRLDPRADVPGQVTLLELTKALPAGVVQELDAASWVHGLDFRNPYLDHELAGLVLRLPEQASGVAGPKALLRAAAAALVPQEALWNGDVPSMLEQWLRRELEREIERGIRVPAAVAELADERVLRELFIADHDVDSRWRRAWTLYALCRWVDTVWEDKSSPPPA